MPKRKPQPADADWIVANLVETVHRCMEHEQVYDSHGHKIDGLFRFDAAGATRAMELLGKRLGMFVDKQETSGKLEVVIRDETAHK